jgi:hypothetical protein
MTMNYLKLPIGTGMDHCRECPFPSWTRCESAVGACPYSHQPPTKIEIAEKLRALAAQMDEVAALMDYYGGLAEWGKHGIELAMAGVLARQWADEIENESEEP